MSRGFIAALVGLAITFAAWWSPWMWPAWPGIFALKRIHDFYEYSHLQQTIVTILLIAWNVAVWALVARALIWILSWRPRRS
ncbi:MAG TPA: hypothetical protein VII75_05420 [Thermoanaerobaculia bacterium]|nr:hypothetical protein [Thermoanaerobaculia bacterium]